MALAPITNQDRLLLGPLTETFTPPPTCTTTAACSTCIATAAWLGQNCAANLDANDAASCWPPRQGSPVTPPQPYAGWGFYSPGYVCPVGYTAACSATAGGNKGWPVQFSLVSQETAIGCCPTGFACANIMGNTCVQLVTSGTISTATCKSAGVWDGRGPPLMVPATQTATIGSAVSTQAVPTFTVFAPMFQLNFQSSDLPATSTTQSRQSTTTSSPAQTTTAAPDPGLPAGAKAGIGVGVTAVVIALLLAIALFIRRRKRPETDGGRPEHWKVQTQQYSKNPQELGSGAYYEMVGQSQPRYEMQGDDGRYRN